MSAAADAIAFEGVRLTHPHKVLYPEQGITKLALAQYYSAIADYMLPHVARRPITLVRCPAGSEKKCFYQRHAGSGIPAELGQVEVTGFEQSGAYLYIEDKKGLIAMVQMGVLEIHPWGARIEATDRPDRIIFDLDPGEGLSFADVVASAHEVRALLENLGLRSFPKTTGGKGLHLVVPITPRHSWAEVKTFARSVGDRLAAGAPARYLTRISIAERAGRIFIDYLRNDPTSTAVAPYSTRSRPGAPVATPLAWSEVTPELDPKAFTIETVPERLAGKGDAWEALGETQQDLPGAA